MTVRIEAGEIEDCGNGQEFRREIEIKDSAHPDIYLVSRMIYATTRAELEIIDHEND